MRIVGVDNHELDVLRTPVLPESLEALFVGPDGWAPIAGEDDNGAQTPRQ